MRILISGATGFIGQNLTRSLIDEGHELLAIVRKDSNRASLAPEVKTLVDPGVPSQLTEGLVAFEPEVFIHLASCFIAQHKPDDVQSLVESNVAFPTRVLEALQQTTCRKVINTGTSWQHHENQTDIPVNLYAASKSAFESMARYYVDVHEFQVVNLKLYDTYGEGDTRPKLFSILKKVSESGEALAMSPGDQLINILHVSDVVNAYLVALRGLSDLPSWSSFGIGSGKALSLKEVVACFEEVSGKSLKVEFGKRPYRSREVMVPWESSQALPGWSPKLDLKAGIQRYLNA